MNIYKDIEQPILQFWKDHKIFKKSIETRPKDNRFVFYDGPPFATGHPHYGHLLGSILKDVIPRFQTMLGKRVERRWGWDCHGLPVEEKVERELGTKNRRDIESKIGIKTFIEKCRTYVNQVSDAWPWYIDRIARWVDMDNPYRTMDKDYMETVIWVFKQMYDEGLIYHGKRISLYCPRCGTPISKFEVQMDNSYKDLTDPSIFIKFKVNQKSTKFTQEPLYLLVWTTTPWTLPENVAIAVNKEETYVTIKYQDEYYILAKARLEELFKDENYEIIDTYRGEELVGLSYQPLFDYFKDKAGPNDFKIYATDFVSMEEGTGLVHMATAYGEDDFNARKKFKLSIFEAIDDEGKFTDPVTKYKGMYFKEADPLIIKELKDRNLLFKEEKITHSYPTCYRCGTPLLYKAQESWYVDMQKIKKDMLKNNQQINWVPAHLKDGLFTHVIQTAPDWGISRTRYWATPIPIWKCDRCNHIEVVGSIKEIEEKSGKKVTDLHRPYIDEHTWQCPECKKGTMRRVPEVVDVWLESGSMPYAQYHYPFENKKEFEANFPGDYVVEYIAQVKAWFQLMHRVATIISNSQAFKNVIATGVIMGNDGRKMSKSYGNYPDPKHVIETYGGDALRLYLTRSILPLGQNVDVNEEEIKNQIKDVLLPYLNIFKYFTIYADVDFKPSNTEPTHILDRWILARLKETTNAIYENLSNYLIPYAANQIKPLIDDISTWFIRRSRDRFVNKDKEAINTLYKVLLQTTKIFAPIIPFTTEYIYQELRKYDDSLLESVHLEYYPQTDKLDSETKNLIANMTLTRKIASLAQKIRVDNKLPLKQPLNELILYVKDKLDSPYLNLIKDELNVNSIDQRPLGKLEKLPTHYKIEKDTNIAVALDTKITLPLKKQRLFRELIRAIQITRQKSGLKMGEWTKATIIFKDNIIQEIIDERYQEIGDKTYLNEIITEQTGVIDSKQVKNIFKIGQDKLEIGVKIEK